MPKERGNDDRNAGGYSGKDKSRGVKHQRDKTKYKPKSVKDPKHVPPKGKRNLGSNWDRYQTEDDTHSSQLTSSTDFSILANAPITQGQHFQFKHDKFMVDEMSKSPQELFSLDLNMLKHSILTIPFYERVGINKQYFTENQISFMKKNAEGSLIRYNDKYNSKNLTERTNEHIEEADTVDSNNKIENLDIPELAPSENAITEDTSELVSKMVELMRSEKRDRMENSEEDLEQWLDDILDE